MYSSSVQLTFHSSRDSSCFLINLSICSDAHIIYGYEIQKRKSKKEVAEDKNSFVESEENVQDSGLQRKRIQRNNVISLAMCNVLSWLVNLISCKIAFLKVVYVYRKQLFVKHMI